MGPTDCRGSGSLSRRLRRRCEAAPRTPGGVPRSRRSPGLCLTDAHFATENLEECIIRKTGIL